MYLVKKGKIQYEISLIENEEGEIKEKDFKASHRNLQVLII
ncbi:MAG: hypothetical protein Ct9H90mP3_3690 [Flammeovirgaceae bacterium]|nr:MAG: hypothetical protein Ct9H90mP3_3690 [Flammeovirgaceae bacterium]